MIEQYAKEITQFILVVIGCIGLFGGGAIINEETKELRWSPVSISLGLMICVVGLASIVGGVLLE